MKKFTIAGLLVIAVAIGLAAAYGDCGAQAGRSGGFCCHKEATGAKCEVRVEIKSAPEEPAPPAAIQ